MKRHLWIGICTTLLVILLGTSALVSKPGQDLTAIKQNIEVFEGILSTVLQRRFFGKRRGLL